MSDSALPMPLIDLSGESERHVMIAAGTEETYYCSPTTALMPDGRTVFCAFSYEHGGRCGPLAKSTDGGLTWSGLLPVPDNWGTVQNCPTIYRLTDPAGTARLLVFAGRAGTQLRAGPENTMHQAHSEDDGRTWTPMASNGLECVMPFCSILPIDGGARLLGITNIRRRGPEQPQADDPERPRRQPHRAEHLRGRRPHLEPLADHPGLPAPHTRRAGADPLARRAPAPLPAARQHRPLGSTPAARCSSPPTTRARPGRSRASCRWDSPATATGTGSPATDACW